MATKARTARQGEGADAERTASRHLECAGLSLLTRNYRSPYGEIDLVMQHDDMLVFVEVRFRARTDYGTPAETVDRHKRSRLHATAEHFLQNHPWACKRPCRFDIVAVTRTHEGDRVEWLRNAF